VPSTSKDNKYFQRSDFVLPISDTAFFTPYSTYTAAMLTSDSRILINSSFYFTFKCTQDFFSHFFGTMLINYNTKKIYKELAFIKNILWMHLVIENKDHDSIMRSMSSGLLKDDTKHCHQI
jgi:hypothetical protein